MTAEQIVTLGLPCVFVFGLCIVAITSPDRFYRWIERVVLRCEPDEDHAS